MMQKRGSQGLSLVEFELVSGVRLTYSFSNACLARKKLIKCKCGVSGKTEATILLLEKKSPRTISASRKWIIW
jgi:hypothetical protein